MGIFFRAKREQLLDTAEPQKKRNLCRWVRSGLIAWKNGRYEPISRFSSFFNQWQVDDALSRFPASLLLVESWFMGRSFLRERSNLRHSTRYRLLRARYVSVSLFCCFVVLFRRFMQSRRMVRNRRWFWNRCYSNCWNDVYESMRSYVGFILASLVYFSLRVRVYFPQSEIYLSSFLSCKIKID